MSKKIVYLMRGLPSCGKSYRGKKLAGKVGLICETDAYFYTHVGSNPNRFDFDRSLMKTAQDWNFNRFCNAVHDGISPIIVDRGNSLALETQRYAQYAVDHRYEVELAEPDSPWWQEIKVLLKYKKYTTPVLDRWAIKLAEMSRGTHRVPVDEIRRRMAKWKYDLSVEDILKYKK